MCFRPLATPFAHSLSVTVLHEGLVSRGWLLLGQLQSFPLGLVRAVSPRLNKLHTICLQFHLKRLCWALNWSQKLEVQVAVLPLKGDPVESR